MQNSTFDNQQFINAMIQITFTKREQTNKFKSFVQNSTFDNQQFINAKIQITFTSQFNSLH